MMDIGFIPLRKGSKGIKNKNKKKLLGKPLFSWVLAEAVISDLDLIFVYTDDDFIIELIKKEYKYIKKLRVVKRPNSTATDTASTEFAMLEFIKDITEKVRSITLLQATSPMTTTNDINNSLRTLKNGNFDSVLSVVPFKRFIWNIENKPVNYNYKNRPRRQDSKIEFLENGAIYSTYLESLEKSKNRLSGNIGRIEMDESTSYEIDSYHDWDLIESLLKNRLKAKKSISPIKYLVLDVDGVFTDGSIYNSKDGGYLKKFDMRDGMGLEIARLQGIKIIVITSENSEIVHSRMKKLNITDYYPGVKDKHTLLTILTSEKKIPIESIAYVGDDINDFSNMSSCGWSFAPSNAVNEIQNIADIVLGNKSGDRAIREVVEFIIKYNKRYDRKL
ncbi:acylneuraminate cytidylyltransferase [Crocinitomicaceae bacterium]|nr:acylneuraminate cytidylyltransferase [Crocinitomicaceae bacterium]